MKQTDKDKTMEGRYRQFAGCDTLKASAKLSMMRDAGLLEMKGRGKATYYVPGDRAFMRNEGETWYNIGGGRK